jgi:hypothetical protein
VFVTKRHDSATGLRRPVEEPSAGDAREEGVPVDEVLERAHAVDLDDRQVLPISRLEARIAVDRDHVELEPHLGLCVAYDLERTLAEAAARRRVDDDASYG